MTGIAVLFGGQGTQYPGMGKALYESSAKAREIYEMAGDILGFDVAGMSFEGSAEALAATAVSQPVIYTHAVASYAVAEEYLPKPEAVGGHSLGEYAALCCAGAFSPEDGFRIIGARARVMERASETAAGRMMAVAGVSAQEVEAVCGKHEGVWAVNYNYPGQTVISGRESGCAAAGEALAEKGARVTRLNVSGAFHTPLMLEAAQEMRELVSGIRYSRVGMRFYSNVSGEKMEIEDYPAYFASHMVSPVLYAKEIGSMVADGVSICVEYGPGKTAVTLAKRNHKALRVYSGGDVAGILKIAEDLGGAV